MMNALLATGAGLVFAILLSSPTFAQTTPTNAKPAPAPVAAELSADTPMDDLIELATTPEDRMRLMLRCAGPPPRPMASAPKQRLCPNRPFSLTPRRPPPPAKVFQGSSTPPQSRANGSPEPVLKPAEE